MIIRNLALICIALTAVMLAVYCIVARHVLYWVLGSVILLTGAALVSLYWRREERYALAMAAITLLTAVGMVMAVVLPH